MGGPGHCSLYLTSSVESCSWQALDLSSPHLSAQLTLSEWTGWGDWHRYLTGLPRWMVQRGVGGEKKVDAEPDLVVYLHRCAPSWMDGWMG